MHAFQTDAMEPPMIMNGYEPPLKEVSADTEGIKHWYQAHYRDRYTARFYYVCTEFADGTIGNWTEQRTEVYR